MNPTIETADIIKQIEKIKAMVICARTTIGGIGDHEAEAAAILLMEADNRLYALMEAIEEEES